MVWKLDPEKPLASSVDFVMDLRCLESISSVRPPDLCVVHEDDNYLALNKPAGMLVHPKKGLFEWTMIDAARMRYRSQNVMLGHRLDKNTSGVIMLTKTPRANRELKRAFQARRIKKTYVAVVHGLPPWTSKTCDARIGGDGGPKPHAMQRDIVNDEPG